MCKVEDSDVLSKERLDGVLKALKKAMADPRMRALSQRAIQGKIWHLIPEVADLLSDLRQEEEKVRREIMELVSQLVYQFQDYALEATLVRSGLIQAKKDSLLSAEEDNDETQKEDNNNFGMVCLDAKERLYMMIRQYRWMEDFFRSYPLHFYENSFQFVDRIPEKDLDVSVHVVGLGIAGSFAASGLAKAGVRVVGYEKRSEKGVSRRYQNASWRAYEISERLLDERAYQELIEYRQKIHVRNNDGKSSSTSVMTSDDRVQIILGSAIDTAIQSAKRYKADLRFDCNYLEERKKEEEEKPDIVALLTGAHTAKGFGIEEPMGLLSWPEITSECKIWLRLLESKKEEAYTTRDIGTGAETWHFTIESARDTSVDIRRVRDNLIDQHSRTLRQLSKEEEAKAATAKYEEQLSQIDKVMQAMDRGDSVRFDYVFTNAPYNEVNMAKRPNDGTVVLDGGYSVQVAFATKASFTQGPLPDKFRANVVVAGGDSCVAPNPLAAYGATLACESADSLVQLAVGIGHLNVILKVMNEQLRTGALKEEGWLEQLEDLKALLPKFYGARSRAENYFQWVQTCLCNLYSIPPQI